MVHGVAHGQGIYTANAESPELSWGFCPDQKMLICGVLDDAIPCQQYDVGLLPVSAESASVRHVGRAIVISDDRRVVPLFEVAYKEANNRPKLTPTFDWARHSRVVSRVVERVLGGFAPETGGRVCYGGRIGIPGNLKRLGLNRPSKRERSNGHDSDLCRRRLVAKQGRSVPLRPKKKAWKMMINRDN